MSHNKVNWTPELKNKAIKMLTNYLSKHGQGECIMQSDNAIIEAPELLSDIADLEGLLTYVSDEEE
jgi:1,2-phenylacetyl-CoA epoxidase catalytic subunit